MANGSMSVSQDGASTVEVSDEGGRLELGLPVEGTGRQLTDGLTTQFDGEQDDAAIAVQPLGSGVRALIQIESAEAGEEYRFDIGGDVAELGKNADGSVTLIDDEGVAVGSVAAPWAFDAAGKEVPTHYRVDGSALIQVVEHRGGDFAYGIVADPSIWWWTKNIATCTAQVASIVVPGKAVQITAKLAKAAKSNKRVRLALQEIKALGGFVKAMKTVGTYVKNRGKGLSATNKKRVENLFAYGGSVLVEIIGLGGCYTIYKEVR